MGAPNILIFECDQLSASVLDCYGGPVDTPNIGRLAADGTVFENVTCPAVLCSPSRASMRTGRYPHDHGIVHNVMRRDYPAIETLSTEEGIKADDETLGKLLNEGGYRTHHYGKWHLTDDDLDYYPDMFREHEEYAQGMAGVFREVRRRDSREWLDWYGWALPVEVSDRLASAVDGLPEDREFRPADEHVFKMGRLDFPPEQTFDVQVADRTIDRIEHLDSGHFFLTCSFNYPHSPYNVPSPYYESYDPDDVDLPSNFETREDRFEGDRSRDLVAALGEDAVREFLRVYYGAIELIDAQVGRVLDAVEAAGRADDTIVVFTADHGDMVGGHGMISKSTAAFYDELVQVPLIVDGIGSEDVSLPVSLTDLAPTLLDAVGQPIPDGIQGESLVPSMRGERSTDESDRYVFCEQVAPNPVRTRDVPPDAERSVMARGTDWKYVRYDDGEEYLYDLERDPGETRDVVGDPAFRDRLETMRAATRDWLDKTGFPA